MIFGNKEQILYGNRFNGTNGNGYQPIKREQTNEEWLKSMNTEELAKWIADIINDTVDEMSIDAWAGDVDRDDFWQRKSEWLEWLKQPHREEKP